MSGTTVHEPAASGGPAATGTTAPRLRAVVGRLPFTVTVAAIMIVAALATGTLWSPVTDKPWYPWIGYGLPALTDGRVQTLVTGPFFALSPLLYLPMTGSFILFVGYAEWRLGTRRTMLVTIVGQLIGVLGAALLLFATRGTGWPWAVRLAADLDVGFSAGAIAVLGVTTAVLRSPWRLRVRLGLGIYLLIAVFYLGNLADLEHLIAGGAGLLAGRWLTRDLAPPPVGRPSRREWRLLAVAVVVVIVAGTVLAWLTPSDGPLGTTAGSDTSWLDVVITVVLAALLVNGLRRGRRWVWWWAVVIAGLNVVAGLAIAVLAVVAVALGQPVEVLGVPLLVFDRLFWALLLVVLIVGRRAFRTPSRRRLRRAARRDDTPVPDRDAAKAVLERYGGGSISWMATWPANSWFREEPGGDGAAGDGAAGNGAAAGGDLLVAYQAHSGVAIALGDPIGPPGSAPAAVDGFARMADRSGLIPCLFSVGDTTTAATTALGWQHVQVAEDTLVDLPELAFTGKPWQSVRTAINRAEKEGVGFRLVTLADEPWSMVERIRGMSEEWMGDKGLPEMGFTLGGIDEALDPAVRVALAQDGHGVLHGVTSWLPVLGPGGRVRGWTLDLMLRRHDGFRPVVEFLIARSCQAFREDGAEVVSLSGAPLAHADGDGPVSGLQRVLDEVGAVLEPLYGFRSLHAFKAKFRPRYEPMHLAYRDEADLARIGLALTRAYLPDTPVRELLKLSRS